MGKGGKSNQRSTTTTTTETNSYNIQGIDGDSVVLSDGATIEWADPVALNTIAEAVSEGFDTVEDLGDNVDDIFKATLDSGADMVEKVIAQMAGTVASNERIAAQSIEAQNKVVTKDGGDNTAKSIKYMSAAAATMGAIWLVSRAL